jgi:hypothetical protein
MFPLALMFESLTPEGSKFLANAFTLQRERDLLAKGTFARKSSKRTIEGEAGG